MPIPLIPQLNVPVIIPSISPKPIGDIKWGVAPIFNFEKNEFEFNPEGTLFVGDESETAIQWVRKALITGRFKYNAYNYRFGNDLVSLIGQVSSTEVIVTQSKKFVQDALEHDSRIVQVKDYVASIVGDRLTATFTVEFITGKEEHFTSYWRIK
jgi:hypothetical protein